MASIVRTRLCKPAMMAETDQYVAFGSEYRAGEPYGIEDARVWSEPAMCIFGLVVPVTLNSIRCRPIHADWLRSE